MFFREINRNLIGKERKQNRKKETEKSVVFIYLIINFYQDESELNGFVKIRKIIYPQKYSYRDVDLVTKIYIF